MITLGIDEVGRGCWAGPLVAGAVVVADDFSPLPEERWRLDDSKKLSRSQREAADVAVRQRALAYGIGWVSNDEIDILGLTASVSLAMRRAADAALAMAAESGLRLAATVQAGSSQKPMSLMECIARIVVDGNINYVSDLPYSTAIIKADGTIPAVSAASIIAKVARDNWMSYEAERLCPGYGFSSHVGYGTRAHRQALAELGVSTLHRRSFRPVAALC